MDGAPPRPGWRASAMVLALVLAVVAAALLLRPPPPETVTLGNTSALGAGGTGVTSDRPVTDLTTRWRARTSGVGPHGTWADLVSMDGGDAHIIVGGDLVRLDTATGAVHWRVPAAVPVRGQVPAELLVLAGRELVTLDPVTATLSGRVRLASPVAFEQLGHPVGQDLVVASSPVTVFDRATGEVRWRDPGWLEEVRGHIGVVRDDGLRIVDLRDGRILQEVTAVGQPWLQSVVLDDLRVVADRRLRAFAIGTGELVWELDDLPRGFERGRVVAGDGVVTTSVEPAALGSSDHPSWWAVDRHGRPVAVPTNVTPRADGLVRAAGTWVHLTDGELVGERDGEAVWLRRVAPEETQLLAGAGGAVLLTARHGLLVLDAATGAELAELGPPIATWPVVEQTLVGDCLVSASLGDLAVRLRDGEPCWTPAERPVPRPGRILGGDGVVVTADEHGIRGLGPDGGQRWGLPGTAEPVDLTDRWLAMLDSDRAFRSGRGGTGPADLVDTRDGRVAATIELDGQLRAWTGRGDLAAWLATSDGSDLRLELWQLPTDADPEARRRWVSRDVAASGILLTDDRVVAIRSTSFTELDPTDGRVVAEVPLAVRVAGLRALHDDILVGLASAQRLVGLDRRDGSLRWELALPGPAVSAPTVAGDVAYVTARPGHVVAVDVHSGAVVASAEVDGVVAGAPVAVGGRVVVPTEDALVGLGPELPAAVSSPAGPRDR